MNKLIPMVRAVQAVDAFKRKPEEYKVYSFFGKYDLWQYKGIYDKKLCERCLVHSLKTYFMGNHLRSVFPYLKIVGANKILPKEHPHCRCELTRVTNIIEYMIVMEDLLA